MFISWRNGSVGSGKKTERKNRDRAQDESDLCVCVCVCVCEQENISLCQLSPEKKKNVVAMPVGIWQENGKYVELASQLETA